MAYLNGTVTRTGTKAKPWVGSLYKLGGMFSCAFASERGAREFVRKFSR